MTTNEPTKPCECHCHHMQEGKTCLKGKCVIDSCGHCESRGTFCTNSLCDGDLEIVQGGHLHPKEEICGAIIHVGFEGTTICGELKKGCVMHDPEARAKWMDAAPDEPSKDKVNKAGKGWDERFDKQFLDTFESRRGVMPLAMAPVIKRFIATEIATSRAEGYKEGKLFGYAMNETCKGSIIEARAAGYEEGMKANAKVKNSGRILFQAGRQVGVDECIALIEIEMDKFVPITDSKQWRAMVDKVTEIIQSVK